MVKELFWHGFHGFTLLYFGLAELKVEPAAPGSGAKVESAGLGSGAAPGSGAKVQSRATLLWGLTPVIPPATEDFTLGPDPSVQGLD